MTNKATNEVDIDIRTINGSQLTIKDSLVPKDLDESAFPAWLNEKVKKGLPSTVYILVSHSKGGGTKAFAIEGDVHPIHPLTTTNPQTLVAFTAWQVIECYDRAYPFSGQQDCATRLNTHVVDSIRVIEQNGRLDILARITNN